MLYRIKLVWTKKQNRTGRARSLTGLARVFEEDSVKGHYHTLWLDAPRVMTLLGALAVVGWFSLAGGLWYWLAKNPFNRVGYADLVSPWRWGQISNLRGQGYIAAGLDALRRKQINEAFFNIRQGLARHPNDAAARLALGRLYAGAGYYPGLRDIMKPQLAFGPPPAEFSRVLIDMAAKNDDQATVILACDNALSAKALTLDERGELLEQKARALLAQKKYAEALEILDIAGRDRSAEWRRLRINILIAADRAKEALAEVQGWREGAVPPEMRLQLLALTARNAGRLDVMAAAISDLQRLRPSQPEPWLEAISNYLRAGEPAKARAELEEFLRRFDANPKLVARAEQLCTVAGASELVQLCLDNARSYGRPLGSSYFNLALTQLGKSDIEAAERSYALMLEEDRRQRDKPAESLLEMSSRPLPRTRVRGGNPRAPMLENPEPRAIPSIMIDYLRTLLDAVQQPAADRAEAHTNVLLKSRLALTGFTGSAEILAKVGHWNAVAGIARAGLTRFPDSVQLTAWANTAAEKIAAAPPVETPLVKRPAATPTITFDSQKKAAAPAPAPAESVYATMAPEDVMAKLDGMMKRQAWAEAGAMLREVNSTGRTWPTAIETDLAWAGVRVAFEQDDKPELIFQVSQRIRIRKNEVARALDYARLCRDRGDRETARTITGKILQEVPGYVAGRDFLAKLNETPAAPEPAKPATGKP
ncbi:MAG: hypothetical protein JSS11_10525 [Verrucomicrobia bacterium]|nr:hypothetical protein [Verrucomicrobiota bacterium]